MVVKACEQSGVNSSPRAERKVSPIATASIVCQVYPGTVTGNYNAAEVHEHRQSGLVFYCKPHIVPGVLLFSSSSISGSVRLRPDFKHEPTVHYFPLANLALHAVGA